LTHRRVAESAAPPPPSPIAPPPLDAQVRQQVEDCLERLHTDLGRRLVLLTHDGGTLIACMGPGDPAGMAHYCQARGNEAIL
jgi:hypothetical protein